MYQHNSCHPPKVSILPCKNRSILPLYCCTADCILKYPLHIHWYLLIKDKTKVIRKKIMQTQLRWTDKHVLNSLLQIPKPPHGNERCLWKLLHVHTYTSVVGKYLCQKGQCTTVHVHVYSWLVTGKDTQPVRQELWRYRCMWEVKNRMSTKAWQTAEGNNIHKRVVKIEM